MKLAQGQQSFILYETFSSMRSLSYIKLNQFTTVGRRQIIISSPSTKKTIMAFAIHFQINNFKERVNNQQTTTQFFKQIARPQIQFNPSQLLNTSTINKKPNYQQQTCPGVIGSESTIFDPTTPTGSYTVQPN